MSLRTTQDDASEFVQILREFLAAHAALGAVFDRYAPDDIPFAALRSLVGDTDDFVLYRLKERSHGLFRSHGDTRSLNVRREVLFDLAVGSLFHEVMKLRESLYQREFYAPRVAALRAAGDDESEALFLEFERILGMSAARIHEVVAEVRILLAQTRDQLRRLLVERAAERVVTRALVAREDEVNAAFPEGLSGLLEAMHGDRGTALLEAARSMLESAYYAEAIDTLAEASACPGVQKATIKQLLLYAHGMQAFLEGDYATSLASLESWLESGGAEHARAAGKTAAAALSRLDRIVAGEASEVELAGRAKELQLRLDNASRSA